MQKLIVLALLIGSISATHAARDNDRYKRDEMTDQLELIVPQGPLAAAILAKGEVTEYEVRAMFVEAGYINENNGWRSWLPVKQNRDFVSEETVERFTLVLNALFRSTYRVDGASRHLQMPITITAMNLMILLFPNLDLAKFYGFEDPMDWRDAVYGR